jgi:hypothetical protein
MLTKNGSRSRRSNRSTAILRLASFAQDRRSVQSLTAVQRSRFKSSKFSSDLLSGTRRLNRPREICGDKYHTPEGAFAVSSFFFRLQVFYYGLAA